MQVEFHWHTAGDVEVFYRVTGPADAPVEPGLVSPDGYTLEIAYMACPAGEAMRGFPGAHGAGQGR